MLVAMMTKTHLIELWRQLPGQTDPETRHLARVLSDADLLPYRLEPLTDRHVAAWLIAQVAAPTHKEAAATVQRVAALRSSNATHFELSWVKELVELDLGEVLSSVIHAPYRIIEIEASVGGAGIRLTISRGAQVIAGYGLIRGESTELMFLDPNWSPAAVTTWRKVSYPVIRILCDLLSSASKLPEEKAGPAPTGPASSDIDPPTLQGQEGEASKRHQDTGSEGASQRPPQPGGVSRRSRNRKDPATWRTSSSPASSNS